jgi:hypothetical protein
MLQNMANWMNRQTPKKASMRISLSDLKNPSRKSMGTMIRNAIIILQVTCGSICMNP